MGDLTKFRQKKNRPRFNESSNCMSNGGPMNVAILTKNGEHGENGDLTKKHQKFNENST